MFDITKPLQDYFPGNTCKGCGPSNPHGFQLKTFVVPHYEHIATETRFMPKPDCVAGFHNTMHGGVQATLLDCPLIFTALWDFHIQNKLKFGANPSVWFVTRQILVLYNHPVPMNAEVIVRASVFERGNRSRKVHGRLCVGDKELSSAEVVAVQINMTPEKIEWLMRPRSKEYQKYLRGEFLSGTEMITMHHNDIGILTQ